MYALVTIAVAAVLIGVVSWRGLKSPRIRTLQAAIFIVYGALVYMVLFNSGIAARIAVGYGHATKPSDEFRNGVMALDSLLTVDRAIILLLGTSLFFLALFRRK